MSIKHKIIANVKNTIKTYNMFDKNDKVVIGVSGGADSIMLLHCLYSIKEEYNLELLVAHVNHKIRKGTAERDASFVEELCKQLDLPFYLKEINIPELSKENGMSEEEMGRKARYDFFTELAGENGKIATAHNANDNVETALMRFIRGTGVKGLSGIPYVRGNIVRPILNITREDIENYIKENNLTHITDETNFENVYTRNKIRLDLIPFIKDNFNPNFINTVNDNIVSYKEDTDYFENIVSELYDTVVNKNTSFCIPLRCLKEEHCSISKRLILKTLSEFLGSEQTCVSADTLNKIYNGIYSETGTTFVVNKDCRIRLSYENLVFERWEDKKMNDSVFNYNFGELEEEHVTYPELDLDLSFYNVWEMNIVNTPNEFYLPFSNYEGKTLQLRTRRDGDVFRVEDGVHKKLNRVFTDKKIDETLRDNIPLLCDGNEVLCAFGYFVTRFHNRTGKFMKIVVQ